MEAFKSGENWQGKIKGYIDGSDEETTLPQTQDQPSQQEVSQTEEEEDNIPGIGSIF